MLDAFVVLKILPLPPTIKSLPIPTPPATVNAPESVDMELAVEVISVSVVAIVKIPCAELEPILIVEVDPVKPFVPILMVFEFPENVVPAPRFSVALDVVLLVVNVLPLWLTVP